MYLRRQETEVDHRTGYVCVSSSCLWGSALRLPGRGAGISNDSLSILSAPEIIDIDQDPLGQQGIRVSEPSPAGGECWARNLSDGSVAALLLARFSPDTTAEVRCEWAQLWRAAGATLLVRDTWARRELGEHTGGFAATLVGHSAMLLRLRRTDRHIRSLSQD